MIENFYPRSAPLSEAEEIRIEKMRDAFAACAKVIGERGFPNRHRSAAFTLLEQAAAMATKSVTHDEVSVGRANPPAKEGHRYYRMGYGSFSLDITDIPEENEIISMKTSKDYKNFYALTKTPEGVRVGYHTTSVEGPWSVSWRSDES